MRAPLHRLFLLLSAFVLAASACTPGNRTQENPSGDGNGTQTQQRLPPKPGAGEPALVVRLEGEAVGGERELTFPLTSPYASWKRTNRGIQIRVHPPEWKDSLAPPDWGLWLFLEGRLREGGTLAFRTGSRIVAEGLSLAPATVPGVPSTRTNHALSGGLDISWLDVRTRFLEGRLHGTFHTPAAAGSAREVEVNASIELYLDRSPESPGQSTP